TVAPTAHFADHPALRPGRDDQPLPPSALRLRWRQVEQAWSTLVEERAA
ncbi:polysaccharide deacetylase, partial [Stenotrophomonas maltophilia]